MFGQTASAGPGRGRSATQQTQTQFKPNVHITPWFKLTTDRGCAKWVAGRPRGAYSVDRLALSPICCSAYSSRQVPIMLRDKSVWFAEEILLDAKLINFQLETGEWDAVEEMLRTEAQLSRDAETGRLRPKKASEYTLRLIDEVLHIMRLDVEQNSHNCSTLAVAEQCLRLVRSCAAAGTKMQTYISKELSILDSMLILASEYQHPSIPDEDLQKKCESCMIVLVQTLDGGVSTLSLSCWPSTAWGLLMTIVIKVMALYRPNSLMLHVRHGACVLLQAIHKLGKESDNFFTSMNKLYAATGKQLINDEKTPAVPVANEVPLSKNNSADNMLSCNETTSECTESESSEQYFECNENPSYVDRQESISAVESLQQTLKFVESVHDSTLRNIKPLSTRSCSSERNITNTKTENDITKVAFMRSASVPKTEDKNSSLPIRKISLEHKIDIGDDAEPPLIIDSTSPVASINTIAEVIPVGLQPKLELQSSSGQESQESTPNDPPTEIHLPRESESRNEVKASPSEISPPLADASQENDSQKQTSDVPKEVKKSQNLSTDFDLGEQLQKILGISSEKTRGDSTSVELKKTEPLKEIKISEEDTVKMPSVKIDSPDSQKARLGAVDMTTNKKLHTSVETVERHVAFGFKAGLVRTLANLCWKNQENKKMVCS
ncbi:hypothetical protein EVAR_10219_1 [Eumeta japonica]|uniref:Uncharacterized protein n=1 Tax=Eumeta variegata TaxID=151549 RepID=A0A4C1TGI6_EUMVA|nr:hypothetical protein EVAR_10219_1 [Eumeta japonica]